MKATFSISMAHDPAFIALTNMPKVGSSTKGGLRVDRFQKTVIMPTYLLAFVVCDFGKKETVSSGKVNVSVYFALTRFDIRQGS